MSRTSILAAALLGLGLAGCASAPTDGRLNAHFNPSVNAMHQPVVQRTDFVFDATTSGDGLSSAVQDRLDGWFTSIGLRYGDRITIDDRSSYAANARGDVARVAARYGLVLTGDAAPITAGDISPGTIRVVASRSTASVEGCPDWPETDNGVAPPQNTSSNYGCATASNLAAMIANPDDLIAGRDGSTADTGRTASRAIRVYREGRPTGTQGLQQTSTTSGTGN
jgi:pilus assembly protein CpaD